MLLGDSVLNGHYGFAILIDGPDIEAAWFLVDDLVSLKDDQNNEFSRWHVSFSAFQYRTATASSKWLSGG